MLLPAHDFTTVPISRYSIDFRPVVASVIPDYDKCEAVRDKRNLMARAAELGLDIPRTFCPRSRREAEEVSRELNYPCVLKPRKGLGATGVRYLACAKELVACYGDSSPYLYSSPPAESIFDFTFPIIQEYIPGETHDLCFLFREGEPRALFTQHRLKTYPAQGGRGIVLEATEEPELIEIGLTLLRELRWHGPGQLEFRIDSRDGKLKLIEMNTRFWGAVDLAIQAGVDFPFLTCRMAVEGDIEPVCEYRVGTRYRMWFPYELAWAYQSRKLASFGEFFSIDSASHCAIWPSDPLPHLIEQLYLVTSQVFTRRS